MWAWFYPRKGGRPGSSMTSSSGATFVAVGTSWVRCQRLLLSAPAPDAGEVGVRETCGHGEQAILPTTPGEDP